MKVIRFKKLVLDRFQEYLQEDYEHYCRQLGIRNIGDQHLLTFLIDQNLIPAAHIQRYTVLQEFERIYPELEFHKTHTVHTLADRFSISERTVWSIIKQVGRRKKNR